MKVAWKSGLHSAKNNRPEEEEEEQRGGKGEGKCHRAHVRDVEPGRGRHPNIGARETGRQCRRALDNAPPSAPD
ncbi:hypothetical protein SKAU_G00188310 [Synaphobranchus kaupii]|uniref:Uncharacterized protein n=1 Tax=Synaphobranchus kaupii TaxID=118154 RepID=A0A9Q1FD45_SYNKA|nr:hypothetical protein SKAU_G00188310 [Synaphobranchus kaupii]